MGVKLPSRKARLGIYTATGAIVLGGFHATRYMTPEGPEMPVSSAEFVAKTRARNGLGTVVKSIDESSTLKPTIVQDLTAQDFAKEYRGTKHKLAQANLIESYSKRFLEFENRMPKHSRNLEELFNMQDRELRFRIFRNVFNVAVKNLNSKAEYRQFLDFIYSFPKELRKPFLEKLKLRLKELKADFIEW